MEINKVNPDDLLHDQTWKVESRCDGEDTIRYLHISDGGRISILDRMTGYGDGRRDIETGYKDNNGDFWLASGDFDIRTIGSDKKTITESIVLIKKNANTCVPE